MKKLTKRNENAEKAPLALQGFEADSPVPILIQNPSPTHTMKNETDDRPSSPSVPETGEKKNDGAELSGEMTSTGVGPHPRPRPVVITVTEAISSVSAPVPETEKKSIEISEPPVERHKTEADIESTARPPALAAAPGASVAAPTKPRSHLKNRLRSNSNISTENESAVSNSSLQSNDSTRSTRSSRKAAAAVAAKETRQAILLAKVKEAEEKKAALDLSGDLRDVALLPGKSGVAQDESSTKKKKGGESAAKGKKASPSGQTSPTSQARSRAIVLASKRKGTYKLPAGFKPPSFSKRSNMLVKTLDDSLAKGGLSISRHRALALGNAKPLTVKFGRLSMRYYERIAGDNPSVYFGVPLAIGKRFHTVNTVRGRPLTLDEYEELKDGPPKNRLEMYVPVSERERILREDWKIQRSEIELSRKIVRLTNKKRRQTVKTMHLSALEETLEGVRGNILRALGRGTTRQQKKLWRDAQKAQLPAAKTRKVGAPRSTSTLSLSRSLKRMGLAKSVTIVESESSDPLDAPMRMSGSHVNLE